MFCDDVGAWHNKSECLANIEVNAACVCARSEAVKRGGRKDGAEQRWQKNDGTKQRTDGKTDAATEADAPAAKRARSSNDEDEKKPARRPDGTATTGYKVVSSGKTTRASEGSDTAALKNVDRSSYPICSRCKTASA